MSSQPWMLRSTRKGRLYEAAYPVVQLSPMQVDPQYWIAKYCEATSAFQGEELFCSLDLRQGRIPLRSDTINGITSRWLKSHGIKNHTAHSTRGAAATALINRGISPALVQAIGDWQNGDTFNKFYNRVRAMGAPQQCLINNPSPDQPLPNPLTNPDPPADPVPVLAELKAETESVLADSSESDTGCPLKIPHRFRHPCSCFVEGSALLSFLEITRKN